MNDNQTMTASIHEQIINGIKEDKINYLTNILFQLKLLEKDYHAQMLSDQNLLESSVHFLFNAIHTLEDLKSICSHPEKNEEPLENILKHLHPESDSYYSKTQPLEDLDLKLNRIFTEINNYVDRLGEMVSNFPKY